jgi:hypothetical protein
MGCNCFIWKHIYTLLLDLKTTTENTIMASTTKQGGEYQFQTLLQCSVHPIQAIRQTRILAEMNLTQPQHVPLVTVLRITISVLKVLHVLCLMSIRSAPP